MKRLITSASTKSSTGTTYYRMTLDDVTNALGEVNLWMSEAFARLGFGAIDTDHNLFGSREISDGVFYLCVTDGHDIEVVSDGKATMQDPETALDYFNPESELSQYVESATPKIIQDNISEYEIATPMFDKWAPDMIGKYSFTSMAEAMNEAWFQE